MNANEGEYSREELVASSYHQTVQLFGEHTARAVFTYVRDLIAQRGDCILSVYRFTLDDIFHVTVIGEWPPADVEHRLRELLMIGQPVVLPPGAHRVLLKRHRSSFRSIRPGRYIR